MAISNKNIYRSGLILVFVVIFFAYHYSNIQNYFQSKTNTYKVQIAASQNNRIPLDSILAFYNLTDSIIEDSLNGWYKYTVGNFSTYQEAKKYRDLLAEQNKIVGAFVVFDKVESNEPKLEKITKVYRKRHKHKLYIKPEVPIQKIDIYQKYTYRIQIGASHESIPIDSLKINNNLEDTPNEERIGEWYKYTYGNYNTYAEAKINCDKLLNNNGIKAAFIVAYLNNLRSNTLIIPQSVPINIVQKPKTKKAINKYIVKFPVKTQRAYIPPKKNKTFVLPKVKPIKVIKYPVIKKDLIIYHTNTSDLSNLNKKILKQSEITKNQYQPITSTENYNYYKAYKSRPKNVVNVITYDTVKYKSNQTYKVKKKSYLSEIISNATKTTLGILILLLIFYLIFNFVLVSLIVFVSRILANRKAKKIKNLEEEFQTLLAEYLFDPNLELSSMNRLNNISSSFKRNILIDEIMKLSMDMSGEVLEALRSLYFNNSLDKDSLKKLRDRRWHINVKGCRELTRMKAFNAKDEIEKMLNSKNEIVRVEAQIAMIELNEDNPYYFLDKLVKPFLSWEHLNVHVLIQRNGYEVPDFNKWLKSSNESVVLFAIEMIRIYKQIYNAPRLINFFEHPNLKLREAAIRAVGEVGYVDCLPDLRRIYNYSDDEFKSLILKTMQVLPEDTNKDFLRNILEGKSHKRFKLEAAKAMASLGVRGQVELKKFAQTGDDEMVSIVNHVFDKRI